MQEIIKQLTSLLPANVHQTSTTGIIVMVVIGLLSCFLGYRFMKLWVGLAALVIGFFLSFSIARLCGANMTLSIIIGLAVGIVLAIIGFKVYKAGIFVFAAISAYSAAMSIFAQHVADVNAWWVTVIAVLAGLAVGFLAMKFVWPVIVITTSISGALLISRNILPLLKIDQMIVIYIVTAVIAVMGMVWQFYSTRAVKN